MFKFIGKHIRMAVLGFQEGWVQGKIEYYDNCDPCNLGEPHESCPFEDESTIPI